MQLEDFLLRETELQCAGPPSLSVQQSRSSSCPETPPPPPPTFSLACTFRAPLRSKEKRALKQEIKEMELAHQEASGRTYVHATNAPPLSLPCQPPLPPLSPLLSPVLANPRAHPQVMRQLKVDQAKELTKLRQEFEQTAKDLQQKYEKKMRNLRVRLALAEAAAAAPLRNALSSALLAPLSPWPAVPVGQTQFAAVVSPALVTASAPCVVLFSPPSPARSLSPPLSSLRRTSTWRASSRCTRSRSGRTRTSTS